MTINLDLKTWDPTLAFFRERSIIFEDPLTNNKEKVSWTFAITKLNLPISYTHCELSGFGFTCKGFGDSFFLLNSLRQSFAEAWERLWMLRLAGPQSNIKGITCSNGFAAGKNNTSALKSSKDELIERSILLTAWQEQKGWSPYQLHHVTSRILHSVFTPTGWNSRFFRLDGNQYGATLAGICQHPNLGTVFDSVYLAPTSAKIQAERKIVRSLAKSMALQHSIKVSDDWSLKEIAHPMDHWEFYRKPSNSGAFEFLETESKSDSRIHLNTATPVISHLVFNAGVMPAVAYSTNESWPKLSWGSASITGKNRWPHPLA